MWILMFYCPYAVGIEFFAFQFFDRVYESV